jgi:hypothetical protein
MYGLSPIEALSKYGETFKVHLVTDGLSRLGETRFKVTVIPGATWRTYAATSSDGRSILLSPKLARLPTDIQRGIILHELGHAVDFLYPAQIVLGRGKERQDLIVYGHEPSRRDLAKWRARDHDTCERFADAIAERAFGVTIGYRGPCLLQSDIGGVRPRPRGLR